VLFSEPLGLVFFTVEADPDPDPDARSECVSDVDLVAITLNGTVHWRTGFRSLFGTGACMLPSGSGAMLGLDRFIALPTVGSCSPFQTVWALRLPHSLHLE
jgi:hypothetical protein